VIPTVRLRDGRERSVLRRHPWVFSGAIARVEGDPQAGDTVLVRDAAGRPLARGIYNPQSQIALRLLTFDPDQPIDRELFAQRIERALAAREGLVGTGETDACRLVHGEADGLPGLVVDRYGEWLVVQFLALAAEVHRETLIDLLVAQAAPRGIHERSDDAVRAREGLDERSGPLAGAAAPELLEITENGLRFLVDPRRGHKTGFYLDQRESRALVRRRAAGAEVLDAFAFTGGFASAALAGGAHAATALDSSPDALALARQQLGGHAPAPGRLACEQADVFRALRRYRAEGRRFDLVVLDPPKFAPGRAQLERALRGYKDINLQALGLVRPGGLLATFSCSAALEPAVLQRTVFQAALDAGREVQILARPTQGEDHPVLVSFPESFYLKGLLGRVW
jgi:23S rRNA (cytosine1962-C5)-methyltransferase